MELQSSFREEEVIIIPQRLHQSPPLLGHIGNSNRFTSQIIDFEWKDNIAYTLKLQFGGNLLPSRSSSNQLVYLDKSVNEEDVLYFSPPSDYTSRIVDVKRRDEYTCDFDETFDNRRRSICIAEGINKLLR